MKKILLLTIVSLVILAGCDVSKKGATDDQIKNLGEGLVELLSADALHLEVKMKMSMGKTKESEGLDLGTTIMIIGARDLGDLKKAQLLYEFRTEDAGISYLNMESMGTYIYYGKTYMNMFGDKEYYNFVDDSMFSEVNFGLGIDDLGFEEMSTEDIKMLKQSVILNEESGKEVFDLDFNSSFGKAFQEGFSEGTSFDDTLLLRVGDETTKLKSVRFTLENEKLAAIGIDFEMDMMGSKAEYEIVIHVLGVNEEANFEFPDFSEYKENSDFGF